MILALYWVAMSQDYVEKILGRLITDDEFRRAARASLLDVCAKNGYVLTYHEFKILENMDFNSFTPLADYLDRAIKRCGKEQISEKNQMVGNLSERYVEELKPSD